MGSVARTVLDAIGLAAGLANVQAYTNGFRIGDNSYFSFHCCTLWDVSSGLSPHGGELPAAYPPEIDWSAWDGVQTLIAFLNSQDPGGGWSSTYAIYPSQGYAARAANTENGAPGFWLCEVAPWMLPYVSGRALGLTPTHTTPPIWPGAANVTLGTPVALGVGFTVDGPMQGVIITLTTVPSRIGSYDFDGEPSHVHVGAVAFANDYGAFEIAQPFSFDLGIICPKLTYSAASLVGRAAKDIEGTCTPWLINVA